MFLNKSVICTRKHDIFFVRFMWVLKTQHRAKRKKRFRPDIYHVLNGHRLSTKFAGRAWSYLWFPFYSQLQFRRPTKQGLWEKTEIDVFPWILLAPRLPTAAYCNIRGKVWLDAESKPRSLPTLVVDDAEMARLKNMCFAWEVSIF